MQSERSCSHQPPTCNSAVSLTYGEFLIAPQKSQQNQWQNGCKATFVSTLHVKKININSTNTNNTQYINLIQKEIYRALIAPGVPGS